jgi:hypothetical protein
MCMYVYIYIYSHTHTHTHMLFICMHIRMTYTGIGKMEQALDIYKEVKRTRYSQPNSDRHVHQWET